MLCNLVTFNQQTTQSYKISHQNNYFRVIMCFAVCIILNGDKNGKQKLSQLQNDIIAQNNTPLFDTDIDCDPGRQFDAIVINFALVCLVITHLLSNSAFLQFAKRLQVSDTDMSLFCILKLYLFVLNVFSAYTFLACCSAFGAVVVAH